MSGHNKWSTIKRKKGALDSKRSKIFSRIIKEIAVAVKESGPDPDNNPKLRLCIQNAKGANMPKENMHRAISKAGDKDAASFQEVSYEGYAQGGTAIFVECLTDNIQRTVSNVRMYFNKFGGTLGTNGSLAFIFSRKGVFVFAAAGINLDDIEMDLIEAGAEDIEINGDTITVFTALEDFGAMQKKMEQLKIECESSELQRIPNDTKDLDVATAKKVMKLIEMLEDDDDVQSVFHNIELTDEIMEELEK
ncbi:MAG: YebC/PmpR family DNA-binding transcriptional regulator [Bacteroidota bacterium]